MLPSCRFSTLVVSGLSTQLLGTAATSQRRNEVCCCLLSVSWGGEANGSITLLFTMHIAVLLVHTMLLVASKAVPEIDCCQSRRWQRNCWPKVKPMPPGKHAYSLSSYSEAENALGREGLNVCTYHKPKAEDYRVLEWLKICEIFETYLLLKYGMTCWSQSCIQRCNLRRVKCISFSSWAHLHYVRCWVKFDLCWVKFKSANSWRSLWRHVVVMLRCSLYPFEGSARLSRL